MNNNDTSWLTLFLRNRHLLVVSIVVAIAAGLFAVSSLERSEDPRIVNRYPIIVTPFPGASAERVESQVTEKLEEELSEIAAIKDLTSTSLSGVSIIAIELEDAVDQHTFQQVFSEIRDQIEDAAVQFPSGAGDPVLDDKRAPAGFTVITAISWDQETEPSVGLLNRLAEDLADRIRSIEGTELVRLYGAPDEELTALVDHDELNALGLSVRDVAQAISSADAKHPSGILRGRSDVLLEVSGEIDSIDRVARIPLVEEAEGSVIRVGDIAEIRRSHREPAREVALSDGKRSIFVAARMGRDTRIDQWSERAISAIDEFRESVGLGVGVDTIFEQAHYTQDRFKELLGNMMIGAFMVAIVVLFMMGWRLGLVVGASLPIVVALTFFTFFFTGDALHQMSVYGMVIALGLLIDNAIVIADEVTQRKALGLSPNAAVSGAIKHLFLPLLASTLTTILAFTPIVLMSGGVGDFVGAIGRSVIIAVSWSFLSAMTITAALAGIFARPALTDGERSWWRDGFGSRRLTALYRKTLVAGMRTPLATITLALFLPLVGFVLAPSLGNSFFPPIDRDMFEVRVWLSNDSSLKNTHQSAEAIEKRIREMSGVTQVSWLVGASFPRVFYNAPMNQDNSAHFAHAVVTTSSAAATKAMIGELQSKLSEEFPAAQILVRQFRQGPPVVADIEYRIYGPRVGELHHIGERIRRTLSADPEILITQATMTRGEPKLWLEANEDQARIAGHSLTEIAQQMQSALEGWVGGTMIEDMEELPVRVRYRNGQREDLSQIASLNLVGGDSQRWVPLDAIGDWKLKPELAGITRYQGLRANIVKAYTASGSLPLNVSRRVLKNLEAEGFVLPAGYRMELGGTIEQEAETRADLIKPLPMLAVFMVAILILVFRSVLLSVTLGVVVVMSVGLAILSTWLIDLPISFNTFMGTFGLIGVALNDSIVVIAAIRSNPEAARGEPKAVVEAVVSTTRHVISTTLTTIGGFLPLILITGGDFWPSLAIVLAGGILGASIMALLFVPAVYVLLHQLPSRGRRIMAHALPGLILLLASGCASVGPDYQAPHAELPAEWNTGQNEQGGPSPTSDGVLSQWWETFEDPMLDRYVAEAIHHNHDLRASRARVREARALRQFAAGKGRPNLGAKAGYRRTSISENTALGNALVPNGLDRESDLFVSGFDASWEIDLFGGTRRSAEAADARWEAVVDSHRDVLVSVIAEVTQAYLELRGTQQSLDITLRNIEIQNSTLEIVQNKVRVGLSNDLEEAQASSQLGITRAVVPGLRALVRTSAHRLAVLTGRRADELVAQLLPHRPLPLISNLIPPGLPSSLLRRRPDVRRAERLLAASSADIGSNTAELFPKFSLTGAHGFQSVALSDLFTGGGQAWSFGPTFQWSVFQGGRIRAQLEAAKARNEQALAVYEQTVLRALADVESALVEYQMQHEERQSLLAAATASKRAYDKARVLYQTGLTEFINLLDSERTLNKVEDRLARSETHLAIHTVAVYKVLGGGWEPKNEVRQETN
jgi:NodT family efflux transporter outer membrane factor (OMF) lipoprotein